MIDLEYKNHCICKDYDSNKDCINKYEISESGKSVKLSPKNTSEQAIVIIVDQCLITDNNTKCDALFLFLTELKGAGDIAKAFKQLAYTKNERDEYKNIIQKFKHIDNNRLKIIEKFIIVSNGILDKNELEKLENEYNIRVNTIIHSEATTPITNLRDYC